MKSNKLEVLNLSKSFRDNVAVNNVNMELSPGVWGLLGANGAGKTTLIRMIAGLIKPTSGRICFNGKDILKSHEYYWNKFGYLPQEFGFDHSFNTSIVFSKYLDY